MGRQGGNKEENRLKRTSVEKTKKRKNKVK